MNNPLTIIEAWLDRAITTRSYEAFDDLNITAIESSCANPKTWLWCGLLFLSVARELVDKKQMPFELAVGFSLKSGRKPRGRNFSSSDQMQREFSRTPPSLYLFSHDQESWLRTPKEIIVANELPVIFQAAKYYYSEYLCPPDPDYRRVLWVVAKSKEREAGSACRQV